MTNVLFVCAANAGCSQMAQALYERRGGRARSAGLRPAAELQEAIVEALEEIGIDVSDRVPRPLAAGDLDWADLVVAIGCDDDRLPPAGPGRREWNLPDPVGLCLEEARELRAAIEQRVAALPL